MQLWGRRFDAQIACANIADIGAGSLCQHLQQQDYTTGYFVGHKLIKHHTHTDAPHSDA